MIRFTRRQVRRIDQLSIEKYHIPGIVLMENAARAAADVAWEMLAGASSRRVLILCGGGNNGGDGLAIARHLHNRGADVRLALTIDPAKYDGDAAINWRITRAMGLEWLPADPLAIARNEPDLLIDAIFGTGLTSAPRPPFPQLAGAVNDSARHVLAVDLPSGLDCDSGSVLGSACIRATRTVTFVAEKTGFTAPAAWAVLGQVIVADIGCPRELIRLVAGE